MSHTHDVLSKLAVAIHCPEGENLAAKMGPFQASVQPTVNTWFCLTLWWSSVRYAFPADVQIRSVASYDPIATSEPSGLQSMDVKSAWEEAARLDNVNVGREGEDGEPSYEPNGTFQ